ncbi:MAG: tryptophan--tRNA ligase [Bacilli bacterium]|jgi:tryptophanyl-tRNA synthetase|nr:tryptophan--tRNA ligase [Bacilli bacterium]
MERILSGIKPTGELTLGNYIGALRHFKDFQNRGDVYIFIADLHALTMPIEAETLRNNSRDIAAFYLASGLDPKRCTIFLQHTVSAHAELNAILQNYLYMGELKRMTQFKDKCSKMNDNQIGLGIFAYPVLMAADILLYDATIVPVGEDQVQHVEITRDLVHRFNSRYGEVLVMPRAEVTKVGARIMSLCDPSKKMSKSDPKGDIFLKDPLSVSRKKIMSAVTDSGSEVRFDPAAKPGISNLLTIYAALKDITPQEAEKRFTGFRYGDFKKAVAEAVEEELGPFKARYEKIIADRSYLSVLQDGAKKASLVAAKTLRRVQKAVGLLSVDE